MPWGTLLSNSNTRQPSNWPNHVRFVHSSRYHSSVPPAVRDHIKGSSLPRHAYRESFVPHHGGIRVVIRLITSSSHPACGQLGLFAGRKIPPISHIIQYFGEIHCDERDSDYDLSLCRLPGNVSVGIDASIMGNQARFINDYRGIVNKPNAIFQDGRTPSGELCMSVWSSNQEIKKGEEIVVSYGKSWWRSRNEEDGVAVKASSSESQHSFLAPGQID